MIAVGESSVAFKWFLPVLPTYLHADLLSVPIFVTKASVIASAAKQSMPSVVLQRGLPRRFAPRNDEPIANWLS